jgi:hypothetical protein
LHRCPDPGPVFRGRTCGSRCLSGKSGSKRASRADGKRGRPGSPRAMDGSMSSWFHAAAYPSINVSSHLTQTPGLTAIVALHPRFGVQRFVGASLAAKPMRCGSLNVLFRRIGCLRAVQQDTVKQPYVK